MRALVLAGLLLFPSWIAAQNETTASRSWTAIDQVRVEFVGEHESSRRPENMTIRNRCGADAAMDVNGFAAVVALRLHYELTWYPGDERRVPNC